MPLFDRFKNLFRGQSSIQQKRPLPSVIEYDVNPHEYWDVLGELGDGAFGKVEKVSRKSDRSQLAAAKHIEIEDGENFEDFLVEIEILTQCTHENIVGLLACYFYDNKLSMMLEFCAGGAVDGIMLELEKPLTEPQIAYITRYVCTALEFLHSNFVIHRDLKAGNILLTADAQVKLADFGVSAKMKDRAERRDSFIGTPYWMAPEVMVCETFKDQPYGCLADIWSLGITLIEMAQMDPPNYQVSPMRVVIKVQKSEPPTLDRPSRWSIFFNDFIAKCLVKNPNDRYSATDLLTHPFIKNAFDKKPVVQLLCEKNADILREEIVVDEESSTGGSVADSEELCFVEFDQQPQYSQPRKQQQKQTSVVSDMDVQSDDVVVIENNRNGKFKSLDKLVSAPSDNGNHHADPAPNQQRSEAGVDLAPAPQRQSKKKMAAPKPPSTSPASDHKSATITSAATMIENGHSWKQEKYFGQSQEEVEILRPPGVEAIEKYNQEVSSNRSAEHAPFPKMATSSAPVPPEEDKASPLEVVTSHFHERSGSGNVLSPAGQEAIDILDDLYNILDDDQAKTRSTQWSTSPRISSQSFELVPDDRATTASTPHTNQDSFAMSTAVSGTFDNERTKSSVNDDEFPLSSENKSTSSFSPGTSSISERVATEGRKHAEGARSARFRSSSSRRESSSTSTPQKPVRSKSVVYTEGHSAAPANAPVMLRVNADDDSMHSLSNESLDTARPGYEFTSAAEEQPNETDKKSSPREADVAYSKQSTSKVAEIIEQLDHREPSPHVPENGLDYQRKAIHTSHPTIVHNFASTNVTQPPAQPMLHHRPLSMPSPRKDAIIPNVSKLSNASRHSEKSRFTDSVLVKSDSNTVQQHEISAHLSYPDNYSSYSADNAVPPPEPPVDYDDREDNYHPAHSARQDRKMLASSSSQQSSQTRLQKNLLGNSLDSQTAARSPAVPISQTALTRGISHLAITTPHQQQLQPHQQLLPEGRQMLAPQQMATASGAPMSRKSPQRATVTKKTRTYVVDGVEVTSTTLHVLGVKQGHELRKKEMQDLKRMQREEARQQQELSARAEQMREHQERKFAFEKQAIHKTFEMDLESLARNQKKKIEELERLQEEELRNLVKKIRVEQERDLRLFKDRLKQEQKILKQEIDLLPKSQRKEMYKARKEYLDKSHYEREADFLVQLDRTHDIYLSRTREKHREKMAETEREFLKQKHSLERSLESALWELEERQLSEKHHLIAQQFKDVFHLQRTHMLARHQKELEHIKKINQTNEEELLRALTADRKELPKVLRNESKTRTIMFKESLRIDKPNQGMDKWAEKIHEFENKEKLRIRLKLEEYDIKCKRRLAQLVAHNQNMVKELEEIHNEKRNMLVDNERLKLAEYEDEYRQVIQDWKAGLSAKKTVLETKFAEELKTQERFYNIEGNIGTMVVAPSSSADGVSNGAS